MTGDKVKESKPKARNTDQVGQGRGGVPGRKKILTSKPISFRLNLADQAKFMEKVQDSGLRTTEYIRDCVLGNKTRVFQKKKPSQDYGRLLFVVNKAGNNINQLAHRANLDNVKGTLSEDKYGELLRELEFISMALRAVVKINA